MLLNTFWTRIASSLTAKPSIIVGRHQNTIEEINREYNMEKRASPNNGKMSQRL